MTQPGRSTGRDQAKDQLFVNGGPSEFDIILALFDQHPQGKVDGKRTVVFRVVDTKGFQYMLEATVDVVDRRNVVSSAIEVTGQMVEMHGINKFPYRPADMDIYRRFQGTYDFQTRQGTLYWTQPADHLRPRVVTTA